MSMLDQPAHQCRRCFPDGNCPQDCIDRNRDKPMPPECVKHYLHHSMPECPQCKVEYLQSELNAVKIDRKLYQLALERIVEMGAYNFRPDEFRLIATEALNSKR